MNNLPSRFILPSLNVCRVCRKSQAEHTAHPVKFDHEHTRDESRPRWHGWHSLRRGLGSNLYALGTPPKIIQKLLRHANVSTTTMFYVKTSGSDSKAAMDELEMALPSKLEEAVDKNRTEKQAILAAYPSDRSCPFAINDFAWRPRA